MSHSFLRRFALCASVCSFFGIGATANAANFVVTSTADSGVGSLREAVNLANVNTDSDTISFDPSLAGQTITLTSGQLSVASNISIDGLTGNSAGITISGNNNSRVFYINPGDHSLSLSNLAITKGTSSAGGGLANFATLNLFNCSFYDNSSTNLGGGIFCGNPGRAFAENCTIANNRTSAASGGGDGGGICINGGIFTLRSCTISDNSIPSSSNGSGIFSSVGVLYISNTILDGTVSDNGTLYSEGYNLFKTGNGFTGNGTTDKETDDFKLDVLANYGGATPTIALQANSPALDAGNATGTDQRGAARPVDSLGFIPRSLLRLCSEVRNYVHEFGDLGCLLAQESQRIGAFVSLSVPLQVSSCRD